MDARTLLDVDMTTLGRWLREGFAWWCEELAQLCPPVLLRMASRRWPEVIWNGKDIVHADGAPAGELPRRALVRLPADAVLVRQVPLPLMSRRDRLEAVKLSADRLMPLAPGDILLALARDELTAPAGSSGGQTSGDGPMTGVACLPRAAAARLLAALAAAEVAPVALMVEAGQARFDFLPAAREAGLVPRELSPAVAWWALVGLLLAFNGATLIWRDVDSVRRLQDEIDARAPMAQAAQKAAMRLQSGALLVRRQAARRIAFDPLRMLAEVTGALPAEAWVQRWVWNGQVLRISGYGRGNVDVLKVLRDTHRFGDVRNSSSDVQAEIPAGRPFDLTLRPRGR